MFSHAKLIVKNYGIKFNKRCVMCGGCESVTARCAVWGVKTPHTAENIYIFLSAKRTFGKLTAFTFHTQSTMSYASKIKACDVLLSQKAW